MNFRKKLAKAKQVFKKKAVQVGIAVVTTTVSIANALPKGYATTDVSDVITDWMPTIISFAMLGMVMGFIRKFR